jgi:hypothetical protein
MFSACVFKVNTLIWANQGNYFENTFPCSKLTLKTTVATLLKVERGCMQGKHKTVLFAHVDGISTWGVKNYFLIFITLLGKAYFLLKIILWGNGWFFVADCYIATNDHNDILSEKKHYITYFFLFLSNCFRNVFL